MRWLKISLGIVVVLLAAFVIGGLVLPDRVQVERSILIERQPPQVFAVVNGFARFNEWSPWIDHDPSATYHFSGPATGVGARMSWSGDKGEGAQEITEVVADERVVVALDFGADGGAVAQHILIPEGGGTRVVWRFQSDFEGSLVGRWFGLLFEGMIGPDYEKGLANLKRVVEAEPAQLPAAADPEQDGHAQLDGGQVDPEQVDEAPAGD
jgi:uncharacterized protein YndB with AHSA1/START domain